jgi:uncharacterized protein
VRFVAWKATHDQTEYGLSWENKHLLIEELKKYGNVVISAEDESAKEFDGVIWDYPQERSNDILAFASIYVGEGNTMAAEAAVLGTPSIRVNTMQMGYCSYLQSEGLMFQLLDIKDILKQIRSIMTTSNTKEAFSTTHQQVIRENLATTDFIIDYGLKLLRKSTTS